MGKTKTPTAKRTPKKKEPRMPVVLRNVPSGYNWGWFSREDQRMHLQVVDKVHKYLRYKVWLETRGRRTFEPVGAIPGKVLKRFEADVALKRESIEAEWVHFMIKQRWLTFSVRGTLITLIAYPNSPNRFERTLDLEPHIGPVDLPSFTPKDVRLNSEFAVIELWPSRPETRRPFIFLPNILWQD